MSLLLGKRLLFKITLGVTVSILVVEAMVFPVACTERESLVRLDRERELQILADAAARHVGSIGLLGGPERARASLAEFMRQAGSPTVAATLHYAADAADPKTPPEAARVLRGDPPAGRPKRGDLVASVPIGDVRQPQAAVHLRESALALEPEVRGYAVAMLVTILLVLLVTGASVTVFLYFVVLRPIHRMIEANVAATSGDPRLALIPAAEIPNDELGTIMESHNSMLRRLSRSRGIIQENNRVLQSINEKLSAANRRLKDLDKVKSQFLANMSHELRTPLHSIIGFTELTLKTGESLSDRERRNLSTVIRSARELLSLINDLLDLSKIESGKMEMDFTEFDLEALLDACLQTMEPLAREKDLCLGRDVRGPLPRVRSDREKLRQVLINLLSNAIKFTDEGGVTLKAWVPDPDQPGFPVLALDPRPGAFVALAVIDTGIGIAEADQRAIFEEFRQVDGSPTRRHKGSGLGLSIVKKLAALLGGEVYVASRLGEGATFTLVIPADIERLRSAFSSGSRRGGRS